MDIIFEFLKSAGYWGGIVGGIIIICITITFITLTGFMVFILVAKTIWKSLFDNTKSSESIQYTLLRKFLLPIIMSGGKDIGKTIMDALENKEVIKSKKSEPIKAGVVK